MQMETTCCIVGGGPAGIMLGFLLARAGVPVIVLEKHKDFFRDFRGDTVHPSTLELLHELQILDDFLKLPHQQLTSAGGVFGNFHFQAADFSHLPTHCKFVVLMPQWDFLDFLSKHARNYPVFDLRMGHEVTGLIQQENRVAGVHVQTAEGPLQIRALLTIGCDGRHSTVRQAAGLEATESGVPIDVLWFRLAKMPGDPEQLLGNINYGRLLILINRGDYLQAGLIVPKNSFEDIQRQGLDAFRQTLLRIAPFLGSRVNDVTDWEGIKLLTVQINRLLRWHKPGLLCIGDSAHAMSPVGGVGINLAIQDAVAAANILAPYLQADTAPELALSQVQRRREFPTRITQRAQTAAHRGLQKVFDNPGPAEAPWQLKTIVSIPGAQRLIARAIGLGARPEHIRPPAPKTSRIALAAALAGIAVFALVRHTRK